MAENFMSILQWLWESAECHRVLRTHKEKKRETCYGKHTWIDGDFAMSGRFLFRFSKWEEGVVDWCNYRFTRSSFPSTRPSIFPINSCSESPQWLFQNLSALMKPSKLLIYPLHSKYWSSTSLKKLELLGRNALTCIHFDPCLPVFVTELPFSLMFTSPSAVLQVSFPLWRMVLDQISLSPSLYGSFHQHGRNILKSHTCWQTK